MFLFGQHARLEQKFGQAVPIGKRQHRNNTHRDADCTLLRHGVFLVGSPDVTRTPPSSRMATLIRKYIPKVLKLDPKLQPGTVMRLLVLAEWAATGAAVPRSRDVLYKIFAERRAPLWRAVQARGLELIKQGFSDMGVL
jgi:hypothetical protein